MLQSILVPLDGTPSSASVLPVVRALADHPGGRVFLVHVVAPGAADADIDTRAYLARVVDELREHVPDVRTNVVSGDPTTQIVRLAATLEVDIVAMATSIRGARSITALTSVARGVLAEAPVPVLLVHAADDLSPRMRTVLVPVDGQPGGSLALAGAIAISRQTGARLVLLAVIPRLSAGALPQGQFGVPVDRGWETCSVAASRVYLELLAQRLAECDVVVETRLSTGDVVAEIAHCAEETSTDLVVMSTHTVAWPGQAYAGSVAEGVVAIARRPVLLVRREPNPGDPGLPAS